MKNHSEPRAQEGIGQYSLELLINITTRIYIVSVLIWVVRARPILSDLGRDTCKEYQACDTGGSSKPPPRMPHAFKTHYRSPKVSHGFQASTHTCTHTHTLAHMHTQNTHKIFLKNIHNTSYPMLFQIC